MKLKPNFVESMVTFHSSKNLWCVTSVSILLICLSLLTFDYISSYANTIGTSIDQHLTLNHRGVPNTKQIRVKKEDDHCKGRYIYMHQLPSRFNRDLLAQCHTLNKWFDLCPATENDGLGPKLRKKSWYVTNQFMLSVIFHNRMKKYECLTNSSSVASAIYAPFYAGLEIGRYLWGEFNESVKDAAALDFVRWLRGRPEWGRMLGRDHFFVAGRITWDFRRPDDGSESWGNKLLNLPEGRNMTMLTIESTLVPSNDIAVPYPTAFHPSSDTQVVKWQNKLRRSKKRRYLFSFGGAPRPNMTGSIREELISQCNNAVNHSCEFVDCSKNDDLCNSPLKMIKAYMRSDFCLQPPGDSYTRRSTFESILAGCIPVFFHIGSAYNQYVWHLPKNHTSYSVFIPENGILNGSVNVGEFLSRISETDVSAMREEVIKLIPRIVYARNKLETFEDAFDVAIKGVLERIEEARRQDKEGENYNLRNKDRKQKSVF